MLTPALLFALTRSPWFLFIVWLQPLVCMTFFLAVINWGFHGFIEFDASGKSIECVNAITIVDGQARRASLPARRPSRAAPGRL